MKRNEIIKNITIVLIVMGLGGGFWWYRSSQNPAITAIPSQDVPAQPPVPSLPTDTLTVYITGAVQNPGLYTVPAGTRVGAVIAQAAGLSPRADINSINLAAICKDGAKIHVKTLPEADAPALDSVTQIHINSATADELMLVPGIGPKIANAIIDHRSAHGMFRHVADLSEVKGVSSKKLSSISPYLTL